MAFNHVSVLLNESIRSLNIKPDGIYVDGTLGGAGHSREIVKYLSNGKLIGIDRDYDAINNAVEILKEYDDKVILIRNNFSEIDFILDSFNIDKVNGILLDLGVSSHQLDMPYRGFSYMNDAPLDMRMDNRDSKTAYDIVNNYSEKDLFRIIFDYGEEKWAKRIAEFIVKEREKSPIFTTYQLVNIIKKAIPKKVREGGPHPAKRTFQAIRIEVNGELEILEKTVKTMVNRLEKNGRLCIITFHSLEDRIVKKSFKQLENPCTCPRELPMCVCNKTQTVKIITKKPILPTEIEINNNPRSRSAKLRVCEKI